MIKSKRKINNLLRLRIIFLFFSTLVLITAGFIALLAKKTFYVSPVPANIFKEGDNSYVKNDELKNFEKILSDSNIFYSSITAENNYYKVKLSSGEEILFDKNKSWENQISSLQLLVSRFTIEGRRFQKLDLRYNNPIVIFK